MTHHNETHKANTETRKRVFVSHAQVLPKDKQHTLSEQEKAFETTCESRGVWLEVFCPDDTCFTEEEHVRIPVFCEDPKAKKSLWLDVFCPDSRCEIDESTWLT